MKKLFIGITLILSASIIPHAGLNSQSQFGDPSNDLIGISASHETDKYSMRLDFMTESQVDDIIQLRKIKLDDLCDKTMGCKSRTHIVLSVGNKIQLFNDDRIKSVELIRINSNRKTTIAKSISNKKESYIIVPEEINRENIDNYMLLIL